MMSNLLLVFTIVSVAALVGSHAATPEVYWNTVLPNSPMPKAVKELLDPQILRNFDYFSASKDESHDSNLFWYSASKDESHDSVPILYVYDSVPILYVYSASKDESHDSRPFLYSASKDQFKDDPNAALFFLENDLYQGKEIRMHLTRNGQKALLLPQKIADSIPFSSKNLTQVYNMFSVKPDSVEAEIMKQTLGLCECKANEGEEKHCATSLESMVDFSTTKLGKKVKAISTEVNSKECGTFSKYKIEGARMLATNKAVLCHEGNYPYVVFLCHTTFGTKTYSVSLVGENDTKVNAVAVCHTDTSKWNPKLFSFQVLKVKPGVPVCHFLPEGHVVWVPLQTTSNSA